MFKTAAYPRTLTLFASLAMCTLLTSCSPNESQTQLTEPEEIRAFWVNLDLFLQRYELYKLAVSDQEPTGNLKEIFSDPQILAEDGRMLDIILLLYRYLSCP